MTRSPDQSFKVAVHNLLLEQVRSHSAGAETIEPRILKVDRQRGVRTGVASFVVLATIAAAWFGVTAIVDHRSNPRPAGAAATPSRTLDPSHANDPIIEPLTRVVGTGEFQGRTTGDFTITYVGRAPELRLRNFNSGGAKQLKVLLAVDLASAACESDGVGTIAGTVTDATTQTIVLQDSSPQRFSDLSYMHAIGLWPVEGCNGSEPDVVASVAAARITWQVPAALRDLAATDRGANTGAQGTTVFKDGRPQRYTVFSNDQIDAVAARFNLTPEELLYLNPLRRRGSSTALYANEQLNLDQSNRDWFWR